MSRKSPTLQYTATNQLINIQLFVASGLLAMRGISQFYNQGSNRNWCNLGTTIAQICLVAFSLASLVSLRTNKPHSQDELQAMEEGYYPLDSSKNKQKPVAKISQANTFTYNALLTSAGLVGFVLACMGKQAYNFTPKQESVFSGLFLSGCALLQTEAISAAYSAAQLNTAKQSTRDCTVASMIGLLTLQLPFAIGAAITQSQGNQHAAGISNIIAASITLSLAVINLFANIATAPKPQQTYTAPTSTSYQFTIDYSDSDDDSDVDNDELDLGYRSPHNMRRPSS